MTARLSAFIPALTIIAAAFTSGLQAQSQFKTTRRDLAHHHTAGPIRIFYDTEGVHTVDPTDANQNQIPDQVEDVLKQTWAARTLFIDVLNFPDPLKSERYRQARYIDVHLLSRRTLGSNGRAYDGLQNFQRPIDSPAVRSICFDVATSIRAHSNPTPAHEFFHLIQNGATFFKTRWYTEGMARWSEHALRKGGIGRTDYPTKGPWPQSPTDRASLFQKTYDAEFSFWNSLALLDDQGGALPESAIPKKLRQLRYSNGQPVLEDLRLNGWGLMKEVLLELGRTDKNAFRRLGYRTWSEENQKSRQNSPFIYEAVMDVARKRGHEIGPFPSKP